MCPNALCFDVRTAAGFHSQLMSVLAGFAFAVIATLLATPGAKARDRALEASIVSLIATLVMLIAASFFYAAAAGEQVLAPRAAIIVLLAGVDAVFGSLSLLYGLTWLARRSSDLVADTIARVTASGVTTGSFFYLVVSANNELTIARNQRTSGALLTVFAGICAVMLGAAIASQLMWHSGTLERVARRLDESSRPEQWLMRLAAMTAAGTGLSYAIVLRFPPTAAAPIWLLYLVLVVALVYELLMIVIVRAIPVESPSGSPST